MSPQELVGLGFTQELVVLITAALPVSELRGAMPLAINLFHMPWLYALLLAVVGNLLPVPFILLFTDAVSRPLSRMHLFERLFHWLFGHIRRRAGFVERYKRLGLVLLVAIPLPVTGAWTGSLAAVLFGIGFWHAFLSIFAGVCLAGVIVTCLCLLGWWGVVVAGVVLVGLAALGLYRARA